MLRSVAAVMRGTLPAQAIGVVILPILTRQFDPVAFGHYQVFQSIVAFCLFGASLRLELMILRADDDQLEPLLRACITINLLYAAAVMLVAAAVTLIRPDAIPFPLILLPLAIAFAGIVQSQNYLQLREERFREVGALKLRQAIGFAATALALAFTWPTLQGIIIADVAGRIAAFGALFGIRSRGRRLLVLRPLPLAATWRFLVANRQQPLVTLPGILLNATGSALMPLYFFATFGAATSGQFGLVERAVGVPVAMILMALTQVFSSRVGVLLRTRDAAIARFVRRTLGVSALVAIVPATLGFVLAPQAFTLVFGPEWVVAGTMARILLPCYFVMFVGGSINQLFMTLGSNRRQTAWDAFYFASQAAVWVAVPVFGLGPLQTVLAYAVAKSLPHLLFIAMALHLSGRLSREYLGLASTEAP